MSDDSMNDGEQIESRSRCKAITQAGRQCKNYARDGLVYCGIHQKKVLPEEAVEFELEEELPPVVQVVEEVILEVKQEMENEVEVEIEEEVDGPTRQAQLVAEVEALVARLQGLTPGFVPPPFTPQGMYGLLGKMARALPQEQMQAALPQVQKLVMEDVFDPEFWEGLWFLINYQIEMQVDVVKRRLTGEYEVDEWGYDFEFFEALRPFFDFLYKVWFRVSVTGMENVPDYGRGLVVGNHSGQLPFDGGMIMMSVLNEHPSQRLLRNLYATWFPTLPFLSGMLEKIGQAMASVENGTRLLEQDELVGVYPEGFKGVGKLYKDRYKLARFGRGGFVRMALQTQAPIIPVSVVGAEEVYVSLAKSDLLARLTGFPYFPVSLRFPWLGLLGLIPYPTKWYIDFGEPILTSHYEMGAANNMVLVSQLTNQTRNVIQDMIQTRLAARRSVFLG